MSQCIAARKVEPELISLSDVALCEAVSMDGLAQAVQA